MTYISKYKADDRTYFHYIDNLDAINPAAKEIIYNFPVYIGAVNLARFIALYEIYQCVVRNAGHIADIGSYKGASLLYFAKLIKLFEPYSPTEVHGFEWFKGQKPGKDDDAGQKGKYSSEKTELERLIIWQELGDIAKLHDLDLTKDLEDFFAARPHIRYKLIFLDCGIKAVMESAFHNFYPRLTVGGIMVLDHYNDPVSPSESGLVPDGVEMLQLPYTRSPTAFFIKR